jgi:glycosyltransferase involved in cell wall biosynthesis
VTHYAGYGGAEVMLVTLLEHLDRSRVEPVVFVPTEGYVTEEARRLGVPVRVVPASPALLSVSRGGAGQSAARAAAGLARLVPRLARELRRERVDVVVTNSAKAHLYGSLAGLLARRPVVWRMHDTMDSPDFAGWLSRAVLTIGRRIPRRVLVVSTAAGGALTRGGIPPERVVTLYNGIDLSRFRDAPPVRGADELAVVGAIGRLTPLKGHHVFLEAAALLVAQGVPARYIIAGAAAREAPGYLDELRQRSDELGLNGQMELISPFDDIAELLDRVDVFVHASVLPDSLPTTVIEAMAGGTPIVATAVGGVPELVTEGENGYLVPPDDPEAMASRIADLVAAPERRAALGARALADARANFAVEVFVDRFATHLESVVRG